MKFALLYVNEIAYDDLAWAMLSKKIDVDVIDSGISIDSFKLEDIEKVSLMLKDKHIDIAITMNFCPAISDACEKNGIKYIAWIYDSPQQSLYSDQIKNSCNYIFSFDKQQVQEIRKLGCVNVHHLPLATNTLRNSALIITDEDIQKYSCDISFIGNLYEDDFYDLVYSVASDRLKNKMDHVISENFGRWDKKNGLLNSISDEDFSELLSIDNLEKKIPNKMDSEIFLGARLFSRKLAFLERTAIAQTLSEYDFRLYTGSLGIPIENVHLLPKLDYTNELPKAYHLSKINLNITLHSIASGVPLRVFDIMGVGGFMLTNYQPEIDELFNVGTDIEVYHNIEELEEKVIYYLSHDDIRLKIALNGYKTVSQKYNYECRFISMMNMMSLVI